LVGQRGKCCPTNRVVRVLPHRRKSMARVSLSAGVISCCLLVPGTLASTPPVMATQVASSAALTKASGSTLRITVLPNNIRGKIRVTGPSGYVRVLKVLGTRSVSGLKPGRYTLRAKTLPGSGGRIKPLRAKKTVSVKKNSPVSVKFTYFVPNTV